MSCSRWNWHFDWSAAFWYCCYILQQTCLAV